MKKKEKSSLLTEVELELMHIVWNLRGGTVKEIMSQLTEGRSLAYTSVSTILRILEQKGVLTSEKEGRRHRYIPLLKEEEYKTRSLQHMVENVFDNTPTQLIRCLIDADNLSDDERRRIRSLLEQKVKE